MFKNILLIIVVAAIATNSGCSTQNPVTAESNILHPELEKAGDQMVSDWKQSEKKNLKEKQGPEIETRVVWVPRFGPVNIPYSWANPVQDPNTLRWSSGEDGEDGIRIIWSTGGPVADWEALDKKGRLEWETSTTLFAVQIHGEEGSVHGEKWVEEKWVKLELPKTHYNKSWKKVWKEKLSKFPD